MEFEPRESQLTRNVKWTLLGVGVVLFAALLYWRAHYTPSFGLGLRPQKFPLPARVSTVTDGYPFAVKLKDRVASNAVLAMAQVTLRRERDHFEPEMVNYTFVSSAGKSRMIMVMMMNSQREAYLMANRTGFNRNPFASPYNEPLVIPPPIEVPQAIEIANANGLKKFFSRADGEMMVAMTLMNSTNGPLWQLMGVGVSERAVGRQFNLVIDAKTGAVVSEPGTRSLQDQGLK